MTRQPKIDAPILPASVRVLPQNTEQWELELQTITPLFGGGYEAGEIDTTQIIRPAAIRGHLRFWWRATTGAKHSTVEDLYAAETKLWGDTKTPGKVAITVQVRNKGSQKRCGSFEKNRDGGYRSLPTYDKNYPPYALQPFQGKCVHGIIEQEPAECVTNAEFCMTLTFATSKRQEIEQAVVAWTMFGGIGARTRRGCGSLVCRSLKTSLQTVAKKVKLLTVIPACYYIGKVTSDPIIAWQQSVNLYKDFRQVVGFARNQGQERNRPGRSRWSEPDSIRRIVGKFALGHEPIEQPEKGFPRADLGLPIIFHFQARNDPPDTTLEMASKEHTRFASPVITKALAMPDGKYVPMLAILESPHVWENGNLILKQDDDILTTVTRSEIEVVARPMQELRQKDVRSALVAYAEDKGFRKESL